MIKTKTVNMIDLGDFDHLVETTYGRIYSFQQQDDCKDRGTYEFTVPFDVYGPEDHEETTIPEIINGDDMGVSFAAWLARDPNQKVIKTDGYDGTRLFWKRNFYPHVDMIVDDLHKRGLIPAGNYSIKIDW